MGSVHKQRYLFVTHRRLSDKRVRIVQPSLEPCEPLKSMTLAYKEHYEPRMSCSRSQAVASTRNPDLAVGRPRGEFHPQLGLYKVMVADVGVYHSQQTLCESTLAVPIRALCNHWMCSRAFGSINICRTLRNVLMV